MESEHVNSADELASGAKTGINAAKEAKKVASTVAKAASGNLAGAAVDAAHSDFFRAIALFLAVTMMFILFCAAFLFPMAVYEAVAALFEQWKVDFYSGTDGRFWSFFRASGQLAINFVKVIEEFVGGNSEDDGTSASDFSITMNKGDLNTVYARKIKAAKEKVTARQKEVIKKIEGNQQIADIMFSRFLSRFGAANVEYDIQYDPNNPQQILSAKINKYDGYQVIASSRTIKDEEALKLVCLHTAQKNGNLANIKLSAFVKWLGYNGADNRDMQFPLGENESILISMKSWTGGFIPQYLENEAATRGRVEAREKAASKSNSDSSEDAAEKEEKASRTMTEKYEKDYGASVVDMLLEVDCPNLYNIEPSVSEELKENAGTGYYWVDDKTKPIYGQAPGDIYPAYRRDQKPSDYYTYWYQQGYRYVANIYCEGRYGNFLYHKDGWSIKNSNGVSMLVRRANNPKQERPFYGYEQKMVTYNYNITFVHVKYIIPVTVRCRDFDSLLEMAGLWEGFLPWDPVPTAEPEDGSVVIVLEENGRAA